MCIAPVRVPGVPEPVPCRGCWQCLSSDQYDWVGRCLAEALHSDHVRFLTLTYAGDTPFCTVFIKHHIQKMLYRLRKDGRREGWSVRYIVTGEYGALKGRVHWHAILFFVGKCPDMELTKYGKGHMFQWKYWPHGATVAKVADEKSFRYVVKYIRKDVGQHNGSGYINPAPSMSKKPPLGDAFVTELARDIVEQGLPLNSPEYSFRGVRERRSGRHRRFWLQGKSRENLMARYVDFWRERWGTEPPDSDFLRERHFDKIARAEMDADPVNLQAVLDANRPRISERKLREETFISDAFDPYGANVHPLGLLMIRHGDAVGSVEAFSDGTASMQIDGGADYRVGRASFAKIEAQLQEAGLRPRNVRKVARWLCRQWQVTVPHELRERLAA